MKKIVSVIAMGIMLLCFTSCSVGGGEEIIEEAPAETKSIATFEFYGGEEEFPDLYKQILDKMEESDAQFFYVEHDNFTYYELFQTDMETFNSIAKDVPDASKASKKMSKGMHDFFNNSYDKMTADANTWFGSLLASHDDVSRTFGGVPNTPQTYFADNQIELSCDGFTVSKIGIMLNHTNNEGLTSYWYFYMGDGDVTTVNKSGDPLGYFADSGETKNVTAKIFGDINDSDKMVGVTGLYLE